jgi:exonuclease III
MLRAWVGATALCIFSNELNAASRAEETLRVMSFNMHAYHPYQEAPRYSENRFTGEIKALQPHIFYFQWEELIRGSLRRQETLATELREHSPDVLFLQEVVAGARNAPKTCEEFYANNTALALAREWNENLIVYSACRGNVGWVTDSRSFQDMRVLRRTASTLEVVHDYNTNPYPHGMVVEGTALVVKQPWQLRNSFELRLPTGVGQDRFFVQVGELYRSDSRVRWQRDPWYLIANIHAPHKLMHFEAAVALRRWIASHLKGHPQRHLFKGVIVGGDFNALYEEAAFKAWTLKMQDPVFPSSLEDELFRLNADNQYKAWASIFPLEWARERIFRSVAGLRDLWRQRTEKNWVEWGQLAQQKGVCFNACDLEGRIDHFVASSSIQLRSAGVLYEDSTFDNAVEKLSDHPAVVADFVY